MIPIAASPGSGEAGVAGAVADGWPVAGAGVGDRVGAGSCASGGCGEPVGSADVAGCQVGVGSVVTVVVDMAATVVGDIVGDADAVGTSGGVGDAGDGSCSTTKRTVPADAGRPGAACMWAAAADTGGAASGGAPVDSSARTARRSRLR